MVVVTFGSELVTLIELAAAKTMYDAVVIGLATRTSRAF
jgi:hypothetical protein